MTPRASTGNARRATNTAKPSTRKRRVGLAMLTTTAVAVGAAGSFLAVHLISGLPAPVVITHEAPAEATVSDYAPDPVPAPEPPSAENAAEEPVLAAQPQTEEALPEDDTEAPFELNDMATALSTLDTDEAGNLMVNGDVRSALEAAFSARTGPLSEAQVEDLQAMARAGLEGEAGEQAAGIVERYYRYDTAYREVADTLENQGNLGAATSGFEQLSIIRRSHLGDELAQQLFGEDEARTRYTLESMRIEAQANLSNEEKAQQQAALKENAPDWLVSRRASDEPGPSTQTSP